MIISLQKFQSRLLHCYGVLDTVLRCCHAKLEAYIDQGDDNDNVKVKKKMLLYYVYTTIVYSLCLPLYNPYASMTHAFIATGFALCQLLMIKVKNHYVMAGYFVGYTFLSIYLPAQKDDELLKAVGTALMHHNLFFLFPDNMILKTVYIFGSQFLIRRTENRVFTLLEDADLGVLQGMIKNFYFSWPLIYIVNHVNSMCLVSEFQKMMKDNKKIENKFREANKQLNETNNKLNETMNLFEKANTELKEALKARELFIASASHELRNPLNSMIGNIELVRLDTKDPKLKAMLERCKICGEVLLALINNILDVAKINAEKLELHYVAVNFLEVFEKIWNISAFKMKEKGIKGELYVSNDLPKFVEMDSHRLMQILLNLVGNSAKFTTHGFVKVIVSWHKGDPNENLKQPSEEYLKMIQTALRSDRRGSKTLLTIPEEKEDPTSFARSAIEGERNIDLNQESIYRAFYPKFLSNILASRFCHFSTDDCKIRRRSRSPRVGAHIKRKGVIKIEIIDTGCGIPEKSLQKLFKPFCQADSSISRRFGGTGLGLYITQQLIQKMGGEIQVYSQENVGSDFSVILPAITATENEASDKSDDEQDQPKKLPNLKLRALVVDDDPFNRSIIAGYFKKLGIDSETGINGQEAFDKYCKSKPGYYHFMTIDLDMPIMDGFEACRQIRKFELKNKYAKPIPIVVVTGNCTEKERMTVLDPSGGIRAAEFYRKPFTFSDCKTCIQSIVEKYAMRQNQKVKVLVVDDDPFNTTFLQEYLVKQNFECECCFNGKEALEKVYEGNFNAVLIDCEMPEMDGYQATRLIKQRYPQLLIIGITGDASEACRAKAKAHGMNMVETKPVNLSKLVDILAREASF